MKLLIVSAIFLIFTSLYFMSSNVTEKLEEGATFSTVMMVSNLSDKPMPLYPENSDIEQILSFLKPGMSLQFAYAGASGDWNYVFLNEQVVLIRSKDVGFSYRFFDSVNVSVKIVDVTYWTSLLLSIMTFLYMLFILVRKFIFTDEGAIDSESVSASASDEYKLDLEFHTSKINKEKMDEIRIKGTPKSKEVVHQVEKNADKIKRAEKSEIDKKAQAVKKLKEEKAKQARLDEAKLKEAKLKEAKLAEKLKREKELKQRELIAAKKAKSESSVKEKTFTGDLKREKARFRHELITMADAESDARYRGQATIIEMKASYERLVDKYLKVKEEATKAGIDFSDDKYKRLLLSRSYQIFVVSNLTNDRRFTILEWSPDKGYESDGGVNSAMSPTLVVQDVRGEVFGIECKYRSSYYLANKEKEISWSSVKQAEQYKKLAKSRNLPVFVAIGLRGRPEAPKYNFLTSLSRLCDESRSENQGDKDFQLVVKYKDIGDCYIKTADYSKSMDDRIKEI